MTVTKEQLRDLVSGMVRETMSAAGAPQTTKPELPQATAEGRQEDPWQAAAAAAVAYWRQDSWRRDG
eukprot:4201654-Pyramimonas_sp.AAC.1